MRAAVAAATSKVTITSHSSRTSVASSSALAGRSLRVSRARNFSFASQAVRVRTTVRADAGKTEQLSKTAQLPEDDGASDVQRPATKGSDAKMSIKDLPEGSFKGKTVFVRADLNVPLDDKRHITDDTRIRASLPTIQFLVKHGAKVVLASHLGRPKKGPEEKFSLKPVSG